MRSGRDVTWLGLTPEPERELPAAVAALRRFVDVPPAGGRSARPGRRRATARGAGATATEPRSPAADGSAPGGPAPAAPTDGGGGVAAERGRVERLILHGTQPDWLRYLAEVTALVTAAAERGPRPGVERGGDRDADGRARAAALRAAETVLDHHRMLIGLPGPAYERVAAGRAELTRAIAVLRDPGTRRSAA